MKRARLARSSLRADVPSAPFSEATGKRLASSHVDAADTFELAAPHPLLHLCHIRVASSSRLYHCRHGPVNGKAVLSTACSLVAGGPCGRAFGCGPLGLLTDNSSFRDARHEYCQ
eukprot:1205399-Pyramimonas_sp.AAC.1